MLRNRKQLYICCMVALFGGLLWFAIQGEKNIFMITVIIWGSLLVYYFIRKKEIDASIDADFNQKLTFDKKHLSYRNKHEDEPVYTYSKHITIILHIFLLPVLWWLIVKTTIIDSIVSLTLDQKYMLFIAMAVLDLIYLVVLSKRTFSAKNFVKDLEKDNAE